MCKLSALLACLVFISAPSPAQAGHGSYGGMPGPTTRQMVARVVDKNLELWGTAIRYVPETRVRKETFQVGDKTEERDVVYTVNKPVWETFVRPIELSQAKAFGADRKPIKRQQRAKRLEEAQPVLVVEHDAKIDPRYLKLVRDDTIFIVLPPLEPPSDIAPGPVDPDAAVPQQPHGDAPMLPRGQQPTVALASLLDGGGRLQIRQTSIFSFETTGMTFDGEGETARQVPATIKQTERSETIQEFKAANVKAFTATGDEVSADELKVRLAKETPVFVSADARQVDPGYLQIIREDALILVVPVAQPFAEPGVEPPLPAGAAPIAVPAVIAPSEKGE